MSLSREQLHLYHNDGYLTIEQVFSKTRMDKAIEEAHTNGRKSFLRKCLK